MNAPDDLYFYFCNIIHLFLSSGDDVVDDDSQGNNLSLKENPTAQSTAAPFLAPKAKVNKSDGTGLIARWLAADRIIQPPCSKLSQ